MSRRRNVYSSRPALLVLLGLALLTAGCASVPSGSAPGLGAVAPSAGVDTFAFATDTFAFPNQIRARYNGHGELYANYCFVLARALRQFHIVARFAPDAPKLTPTEYAVRIRDIASRRPWEAPVPAPERIVIPGYANLRDFSRGEERVLKDSLSGRWWTFVHWTNWRVTVNVDAEHQETVAREILDELTAGRLVQLLVTNWPKPELNHTVVAFAFRAGAWGSDNSA